MPSGGQDRKADAAGVTSSLPPETVYDAEKAALIDASPAIQLLQALRHPGEGIWLQTFADAPDETYKKEEKLSRSGETYKQLHWRIGGIPGEGGNVRAVNGIAERYGPVTLAELEGRPYLLANLARVGVYFAVNTIKADAKRRNADTVERVTAVFLDLDGSPLPAAFPIQPTAVVESSPGRYHVYWAVDGVPPEEFRTLQKTLTGLYSGDPVVCDLARVMRLPGYWHGKQETGFLVQLVELNTAAQYTRDDLLTAWPQMGEALRAADAERLERQARAERLKAEAAAALSELGSSTAKDQTAARMKYTRIMLEHCRADLLAAPVGQRNSILNAVAFRVGRHLGVYLDGGEATAVLSEAAEQIGLGETEIRDTVARALHDGQTKEPFDFAQVGARAGRRGKVNKALIKVAEVTSGQRKRTELPDVDNIPLPAGEGDTYSDQQVKELLGITWPVLAVDTEKAHAYRLRAVAGDDLGYVPELGGYVAWNGRQWLSGGKDGPGQVEAKRQVQGLGVAMQPELDRLLDLFGALTQATATASMKHGHESPQAKALRVKTAAMEKAYYQHGRAAKSTESDAKQKAVLSSARTLYVKDVRDFEPRPWLVGFQNGVWDRGEFRAAQREDHMLTLASVAYHPTADQTDWLAVLDRITGGDTDLQRTLQEVAGYALSGASSLRLLPWLYGEAGTGKSTYSELLATVLGDMAATVDPKLFAADAARERLGAAIWGKRVALCAEAGNQRLDAEALKTLSGGDRLSVRMLYAEGFTARASHVLLMVANDAPKVEAYDDALKDRVLALPFNHSLKAGGPLLGGRRLEELRQDINSELVQGFTAWAVEGLARVYQIGDIHRAEVCQAATREFWAEVDPLHEYWMSLDVSELVIGVKRSPFYQRYKAWCLDNGMRPLGVKHFGKACRSVGLEEAKSGVALWKLTRLELFPGQERLGRMGRIEPVSTKPVSPSPTRKEEKGFSENHLDSAHSAQREGVLAAAGWEGDDL